jgi:hypothetical protein
MMKKLLCVVVLTLVASLAFAQVAPQSITLCAAKTYTASTPDTLVAKKLGGATMLSLEVAVEDSAAFDIYVQYAQTATGTYGAILTDSLVNAANAGVTQEYSLLDGDSDLYDGKIMGYTRVIIAPRSTANGVTTPKMTVKWFYVR